MANKKFTDLSALTGVALDDQLAIVDTSASSSKRVAVSELMAAPGGIVPASLGTATGLSYRLGLAQKNTISVVMSAAYVTYLTITTTSLNKEVEIEYGANIQDAASGATRFGNVRIQVDGVTLSGSDIPWQTYTNNLTANVCHIISHTPTAGSHTWTLQVNASTASASYLNQAYMRINQIT